ncbi:MAG: adenylyl-sulfate kinase [Deltaproteobacteria bacterium]|nr:adenylyl-sulfate kinase [Deltaproteobacteria bacterium]
MNKGFCVWFTGLSASGKTTLSRLLEGELLERGVPVQVLEGREIRDRLSSELSYSKKDRETHLGRISFVTRLLVQNGVAVLVAAAISPFQTVRDEARAEIGDFVEVYLDCPLEVCRERDPKGLYRQALSGEIQYLPGINVLYEIPKKPELIIQTHLQGPEDSLAQIVRALEILGKIPSLPGEEFTGEESEVIRKRLTDLGYL